MIKFSALVMPVNARKLVNGLSLSSGIICSRAFPTTPPIPVCVTVIASPKIPAT